MKRHSITFALSILAGLAGAQAARAADVIVTTTSGGSCTITPSTSTIFTLNAQGDVLIQGDFTGGTCSSGGGGGSSPTTPSFTGLTPAPANLTASPTSLSSSGGTVTPNMVAYYANSCTGSVSITSGTGCPAVTGAWAGGTVCTGTTNANSQLYCSASSGISMPANTTSNNCAYTFKASCINTTSNTTVNSQNAVVTVSYTSSPPPTTCTEGSQSGDLSSYGYTRQCSGTVRSMNNTLNAKWDNTYNGLMSGDWPGSPAQTGGYTLIVTVNANQFGSFKFNTGSTPAGVSLLPNQSYGVAGMMSVSTVPGDVFSGTSLCYGSQLSISSKSGTAANCKLSLNTDYYLNISNADFFAPHATDCSTTSCAIANGVYLYSN